MTVQELIDALLLAEDKTLQVVYRDYEYGDFSSISTPELAEVQFAQMYPPLLVGQKVVVLA